MLKLFRNVAGNMYGSISFVSCIIVACYTVTLYAECKECGEVKKGAIPVKYLDKTLKALPSGIVIIDAPEAVNLLNDSTVCILWVDTRPHTFFLTGAIKNSVHMFYDQDGAAIPDAEKETSLSKEKLKAEMKNEEDE